MDKKIRGSLVAIGVVGLLAVGAYVGWFAGALGKGLADDPAIWGQFGDYLGGFLNPMIAAAAFYWLTQSVRIQHTELTATREALNETAKAQAEAAQAQAAQVNALKIAARLSAAIARLQAAEADLLSARQRFQLVAKAYQLDHAFIDHDLVPFRPAKEPQRLDAIQDEFNEAVSYRESCLEHVDRLSAEI